MVRNHSCLLFSGSKRIRVKRYIKFETAKAYVCLNSFVKLLIYARFKTYFILNFQVLDQVLRVEVTQARYHKLLSRFFLDSFFTFVFKWENWRFVILHFARGLFNLDNENVSSCFGFTQFYIIFNLYWCLELLIWELFSYF